MRNEHGCDLCIHPPDSNYCSYGKPANGLHYAVDLALPERRRFVHHVTICADVLTLLSVYQSNLYGTRNQRPGLYELSHGNC